MKKLFSVRTIILAGSFLLQLNTLCFQSRGAAGDVDLSFDAGSSVTNPVSVVVVQPDRKVLIGGPFTFINGTNHYASARLNVDGSRDITFVSDHFNPDLAAGQGPNDYVDVRAVAVQSDGKVIVGGVRRDGCAEGEEGCQDIYSSFVIRLNPNGSRDTSFTPFGSSGLALEQISRVQTVALQSDGKVLVGFDYVYAAGIVRLNTNGTLDTNFNVSITYWNSGVHSIASQPDGKVLIGGNFSFVNGTNRSGLARLHSNGSLDGGFNPGFLYADVRSLTLQPDGKLLVGGSFTFVNDTNLYGIARFNSDGSRDSTFNPVIGAWGASSIALQSDGKVLVGGGSSMVNGVFRPYVVRLYGDSTPSLNITRSNAFVIVSWPFPSTGFVLQQNTDLSTNNWATPPETITENGTSRSISISPVAGRRFFRLFKP